jgi:hypothetical protein
MFDHLLLHSFWTRLASNIGLLKVSVGLTPREKVKKLVLMLFAFGASAAFAQASYDLGQKLSDGTLAYIPKERCLTAPGTVEPCMRVRASGVIFTVGYRSRGKVVTYVETHDPAFSTSDGLRVGSLLGGRSGTLAWMNAYGEVVGPASPDGWRPVVARERLVRCANGAEDELRPQDYNAQPCPVRVLGFKKRATPLWQASTATPAAQVAKK